MKTYTKLRTTGPIVVAVVLILLIQLGCAGCAWNLDVVDYAPVTGGDWEVSTPEEQGLDPSLIEKLFYNATKVETLHGLLVIKNGYLVAEGYFNGGAIDQTSLITSVTKSYTSALVGIALEQGHLSSLDQKMVEFFPELTPLSDPRKEQITVRQMLQMRAGYPWEESTAELFELLYTGFRTRNLADVPLVRDPGSGFDYSNLTSHLLGVIVARAAGTDLKTFAETNLYSPLNSILAGWTTDWEYNYNGHGDMEVTARDMAKFGHMYLNEGVYEGAQVVPASWVRESLKTYSEDAWRYRIGKNFTDLGYGYQWWSARAGGHHFNFAWGHGGQQVALVDDLDMVIVVKADPLHGDHGADPWKLEKANLNLVGNFIATLPDK